MILRPLVIILLSLVGVVGSAQDMRQVFLQSPDHLIPALTRVQKQDLITSYDADNVHPQGVQNVYGAQTKVLQLTPFYIHIELDNTTDLQFQLIPLQDNEVLICMVVTSTITPCQSVIRFFDSAWHSLSSDDYLQMPEVQDFFLHPNDISRGEVKSALIERGSLNYAITCAPDRPQLTIRITTFDDDYAQKLYPSIPVLLRDRGVVLEWSEGRFHLSKAQ